MNQKVASFTEFLLTSQALQFGDFTLKSGRQSPYFINAGAFNSGQKISRLGDFYAQTIIEAQKEGVLPEHIDTVFGPAYKGIPLAVSVSSSLWNSYHKDIGYTFDRKEAKDHGDKGIFVGTQLVDGMNVLLIDDVMTAGTAVRHVVPQLLAAANITIVGMILSVDRMEKTADSPVSAIKSVEEEFGFPIIPIANVEQIFSAAREIKTAQGNAYMDDDMYAKAQEYLATYGVK